MPPQRTSRKGAEAPSSNSKKEEATTPKLEVAKDKVINHIDKKIDTTVKYEFGGPAGVTFMMFFFPWLMMYFWICIDHNKGRLIYPTAFTGEHGFVETTVRVNTAIYRDCFPTLEAHAVYWIFTVFEAILAMTMPGPMVKGLPIPSENMRQLEYKCNGVWSFYVTCAVAFVLHYTGLFRLTWLMDNFGPLLGASIAAGWGISVATYVCTLMFGKPHRMSGNHLYDLFMGAPLNPRLFGNRLDLKMWAEIRIPWVLLFFISLSAALKQYEVLGYTTWSLYFMTLAHLLYVNACMKGEECIPTTWDIFYEKWGFMLIFWNFSGVPFTYCISSLYALRSPPIEAPFPCKVACFVLLLAGYYIWDTANGQKNRFRMQMAGTYIKRNTFPQLPWTTLKNPEYIKTSHGSLLLTSGWWGYARKINYTADLMMALSWGLSCGFRSFLPYFYVTFFFSFLQHRVWRDQERCAEKYGADWVKYCKKVPYVFIPYVY